MSERERERGRECVNYLPLSVFDLFAEDLQFLIEHLASRLAHCHGVGLAVKPDMEIGCSVVNQLQFAKTTNRERESDHFQTGQRLRAYSSSSKYRPQRARMSYGETQRKETGQHVPRCTNDSMLQTSSRMHADFRFTYPLKNGLYVACAMSSEHVVMCIIMDPLYTERSAFNLRGAHHRD